MQMMKDYSLQLFGFSFAYGCDEYTVTMPSLTQGISSDTRDSLMFKVQTMDILVIFTH